MKKLLTILSLILALVLVQNDSFAQPDQSITFRPLWNNYINPQPTWENWGDAFTDATDRGIEVAYGRHLHKGTWLMVPGKIGTATYPKANKNGIIANVDLLLQNYLCNNRGVINPSLHLGLGTTYDFRLDQADLNIPFGAGIDVRLLPNLYLNAQTQYRFSIENRPGWQHGVGLVFYFGEPDRDGDGISDKDDKCPDDAGLKALLGCPDRDGDGIADIVDNCPDVAGLANLMGCPDRDGDGIADGDDKCPDIKGPAETMGCPDRDSDGVLDAEDDCPDVQGLASLKGCPDSDGDGITDLSDKCPREAGPAATMGCPDRDGDGVADKDDACPTKRGDSAHKGCPDTDGDGVYDDTDRCVDVPGVAALNGCPEPKKEVAPVLKMVQFQTGKYLLGKDAYPVLDEVVTLMGANTALNLTISGHADDIGDDNLNQTLSERRAKACTDYLVRKGVAAARISATGYGETKPIGDNKTTEGRDQNRRAELELRMK